MKAGFSLIEVAVALAIVTVCLVAILSLIPVGFTNNQRTFNSTSAASIASSVVSDLRAAVANAQLNNSTLAASPQYNILISTAAAGGGNTIAGKPLSAFYVGTDGSITQVAAGLPAPPSTPAQFLVRVGFNPPAAGSHTATVARIVVSWPPEADTTANNQTWTAKNNGSYETTVYLDCN